MMSTRAMLCLDNVPSDENASVLNDPICRLLRVVTSAQRDVLGSDIRIFCWGERRSRE